MLYYFNLYNMLNGFYNDREDLYIQNQSALNYALNIGDLEGDLINEESGMASSFEMKSHGLLNLIVVESYVKNDTIASAHFIGNYATEQTAMYVSDFSSTLSYSGNVKLIGNKLLPGASLREKFLNNSQSNLISSGTTSFSGRTLPEISPDFKLAFQETGSPKMQLKDLERTKDSVYFNSFLNKPIEVRLTSPLLHNMVIKGNFILYASDSLVVDQTNTLQDVIIKAPVVRISKGFKGSIQAFATKKIEIEDNVTLSYPSVVSIYNDSDQESKIVIGENTKVYGAVVLFGSSPIHIDENEVLFLDHAKLVGDVYCTGKLMLKGSVFGSVFTNRFFSRTTSNTYENCIIDAEIDISKRPDYFVSIPLFKSKNERHGVFKKVL